jgi:hypothetical protein
MADDTLNENNINVVTASVDTLNDSIESGIKELKGFKRALAATEDQADSAFTKILKKMKLLPKTIQLSSKEMAKFDAVMEDTEKSALRCDKTMAKAMFKGTKQNLIFLDSVKETNKALFTAGRNAQMASNKVSELSDNFKAHANAATSAQAAINKLNEVSKKNGYLTEEQGKQLDAYKKELVDANTAIDSVSIALREESKQLKETQHKMIELSNSQVETIASARAATLEVRKFQGGIASLGAHIEELQTQKVIGFFKQVGTMAAFTIAAKKVGDAFGAINEHAHVTSRLALSLGDTTEVGMGRVSKSATEASGTIIKLTRLSIDLGYSMEEMSATMNKVRSGIRMDKEGRLSEESIRGLTEAAGYFARVSGMELSESVALMEARIKRYGMTAKEATANMQDMRNTLVQMTAGNKNNTIAMGDMVNIIEEASAASQSYIVDTRLMTQALRGAVNQAENLGVAQKQAKDVAKSVGKILSNSPEFIKIPAGFDLVNQLMGKDAAKLLDKLDAGTKAQVMAIQAELKSGQLGQMSGARALMDLIGSTPPGIEAASKVMERTILKGGDAAMLVAAHYSIENMATAARVTKMMKDAIDLKNETNAEIDAEIADKSRKDGISLEEATKQLGRVKVSFSAALAKDAADMNAAIDKTTTASQAEIWKLMDEKKMSEEDAKKSILETARKALATKGLSTDQIEQYMAAYKTAKDKEAELDKQVKEKKIVGEEEIAARRKKLNKDAAKKQMELMQSFKEPFEAIKSTILSKGGEVKIHVKKEGEDDKFTQGEFAEKVVITPEDFKKAGMDSVALGKAVGINYEKADRETRNRLDKMVEQGTTQEQIDYEHNKALNKTIEDTAKTAAAQDPLTTLINAFQKSMAWMDTPIAQLVVGIAGMGVSLALMYSGQRRTNALLAKLVTLQGGDAGRDFLDKAKDWWSKRRGGGGSGGRPSASGRRNESLNRRASRGEGLISRTSSFRESFESSTPSLPEAHPSTSSPSSASSSPGAQTRERISSRNAARASRSRMPRIGRKSKYAMGAAALIAAGGAMMYSSPALGAEAPTGGATPPSPPSGGGTAPEPSTGSKIVNTATNVGKMGYDLAGGAGGIAQMAAPKILSKGLSIASKFTKLAKFSKAIPFVGNIVAGGFAIKQAWDLYSKWKEDPNSITATDKLKMATALAGMIPGIGNAISAADVAMDVTGGYDMLEDIEAQKKGAAQTEVAAIKPPPSVPNLMIAESNAGRVVGTPTGVPEEPRAASMAGGRVARYTPNQASSDLASDVNIGSLTPDGALTLKVRGFNDIIAQINKQKKALAG